MLEFANANVGTMQSAAGTGAGRPRPALSRNHNKTTSARHSTATPAQLQFMKPSPKRLTLDEICSSPRNIDPTRKLGFSG